MKYAGFGKRFKALLVDMIVWIPLTVVIAVVSAKSRTWAMYLAVPSCFLGSFYQIYFHAKWGQTIGKMAAKIKVLKLDGQPISWREATLRSSVDLLLGIASTTVMIMAYAKTSDDVYRHLTWLQQSALATNYPVFRYLSISNQLWGLSELIVLLFNEKRRALHDFIAGTVVVQTEGQTGV